VILRLAFFGLICKSPSWWKPRICYADAWLYALSPLVTKCKLYKAAQCIRKELPKATEAQRAAAQAVETAEREADRADHHLMEARQTARVKLESLRQLNQAQATPERAGPILDEAREQAIWEHDKAEADAHFAQVEDIEANKRATQAQEQLRQARAKLIGLQSLHSQRKQRHAERYHEFRQLKAEYAEVVRVGPIEGVLERFVVFMLVLYREFEAVAFFMAAKHFIAEGFGPAQPAPREPGQAEEPDPHQTDEQTKIQRRGYVLGTFISFGIAILGGLVASEWILAKQSAEEEHDKHQQAAALKAGESKTPRETSPGRATPTAVGGPSVLAGAVAANGHAGFHPNVAPGGKGLPMTVQPKPVLMNVDTGVDDALAIVLALHLSNRIRLLGITTVAGNTSCEQAALNTRYLLDRFGCADTIPVLAGANQSLQRSTPQAVPDIHGVDGLGGVSARYWDKRSNGAKTQFQKHDAVEFILKLAREYGPALTIVSTAPLTNLALALQKDAAAFKRVGKLEIMAGAVGVAGNITPFAEFNVHCDPEACALVLQSGVPATLYPLDVTEKVRLRGASLTPQLGLNPDELELIKAISKTYMDFHQRRYHFYGSYVHDALPVAGVVDRAPFTYKTSPLVVECADPSKVGQTRWAQPGEQGALVEVAVGVREDAFLKFFWQSLSSSQVVCKPPAELP
jgi:purine nucleosidase